MRFLRKFNNYYYEKIFICNKETNLIFNIRVQIRNLRLGFPYFMAKIITYIEKLYWALILHYKICLKRVSHR
jgi:hypothetical protein